MRYVAAVKQVPDTVMIKADGNGNLVRTGVPSVLDPCSEYAVETAVSLKREGDTVAAVTMGPGQARSALFRCLEIGADEAYLLSDRDFAGADVHATATVLKAFLERYAPDADLILCGKQASDGDTAQVPAELAAMMGREQFCYAVHTEYGGDGFVIRQDYGDEIRTCRAPVGSVVSVQEGSINRPLPSIRRFLDVSSVGIKILGREDLGLDADSVGTKGSRTKIIESRAVRPEHSGHITDGTDPRRAAEYIGGML